MTEAEWMEKLKNEGYAFIGVPEFGPNAELAEHTHDADTFHVILKGQITLTDKNGSATYTEGNELQIPAGTTHRGKSGPDGCRFITASKTPMKNG